MMTNAYIQDNDHTNSSDSTGSKNDSITTNPNPAKRDTNCNITNDFIHNQKGNLITVPIPANGDDHTNTNKTLACGDAAKNISNDCFENINKTNEIPERNTVLKYVYKNNDEKLFRKDKSAGHPLNSIRKKRDVVLKSKFKNIKTGASVNAPLIVNYETYHAPGENNDAPELPIYKRLTENTIQNSALADFNIKTLHEPSQPSKNNDIQSENSSSRSAEDSKERGETRDYKSDENQSYSEESLEQQDNRKNIKKPHSDYTKSGTFDDGSDEIQEQHPYKRTPSNEDSRGISEEDEESSQKSTESYKKHNDHPQRSDKRFESYDENPRKADGSFEKYEENPRKTEGSFEKYEDKEDPPPENAAYAEPRQSAESYESKENLESLQSVENSGSQESRENSDAKAPATAPFRQIKDDSQEHNDRGDYKDVSGDNNDSEETEKVPYKEIKDDSLENNDSRNYRNKKPRYENHKQYPLEETKYKKQRDSGQSLKDNYENNKHGTKRFQNDSHLKRFSKKAQNHGNTLGTPPTIQDIGSKKFSYEQVRPNDEGRILPVAEHDDKKPFISVEPIVESDLDNEKHVPPLPSSEIDEHLRSEIYESIKQPIRKYDGEIKPVVELNNENNGGASSEEFSKESIKSDPEKDVSLESILDVKQKVIIDHDDEQKITEENGDVKQQFERIPTNYKHKNSKVEENDKTVQETQRESPNDSEIHNEGTVDTFSPKDINYDEHLRYKFDDITIKLPEIKLPEDILDYAYEKPSYDKKSDSYAKPKYSPKKKFFQYSDENTEDSPDKYKKSETHSDKDDDDHHYYGYHGSDEKKQKLKKKENSEEDDEGIDLYEKFVRERFGKQGSFEKRSEKLQNAENLPYNPKLYDTVQHILKQTAQIDKQAKKSGDPNAGYMWTLEYGEKL